MDADQWTTENRPADDPDYLRLIDVTNLIESEIKDSSPKVALGRRFDYDVALTFGKRRSEETSREIKLENPDAATVLGPLTQAWSEGFVFGALAYRDERRGRSPEALLDRIALANVNQRLAVADDDERTRLFLGVISVDALAYVSSARSLQAERILRHLAPTADHTAVKALIGSHWMDGLVVGLVFQELGGHRAKQEG